MLGVYRLSERQKLVHSLLYTYRGGRHEVVYYGGISYHRDKDWDGILESRDVRGWWATRGNFGRATEITTRREDLGPCLFDFQVYGSSLFHLVVW